MRVTKAQAQENRARIVETASELFRERGYDGVGVADLMAAAGFTHGGFYKHFGAKTDLMAEASACGIAQTLALAGTADVPALITHYLSREHRDARATGCTLAALGADAARQPETVKATFAAGIEELLAALGREDAGEPDAAEQRETRAAKLDLLAHLLGALVLSRACPDDSPLADEILEASRSTLLASRA